MMSQVVMTEGDDIVIPFYVTPNEAQIGVAYRFSSKVEVVWGFNMKAIGFG